MVLYVLISQVGLIVGNQIASAAAASGPAIYNYTWLVLMLPFGIIGVTVLTVVMPRLSRNAAADDIPAVLADLSLATRLTMVTLIPIVAFMTVAGPAIGSALFAYGNFGDVDAGYLGMAITLSAFTLIPYALVLLQLRVFYAREQPWTPIIVIVVITTVKIAASLAAPHLTADREMVAGYLGLANGIGFLAGAIVGYILLRANLNPPGARRALPSQPGGPAGVRGGLIHLDAVRTALVATAASLIAGLIAHVVDRLLGLESLTENGGGAGSMLRLLILGLIMLPIIGAVMLAARVPDAHAAVAAVQRRLGRAPRVAGRPVLPSAQPRPQPPLTYPDQRNSFASRGRHSLAAAWRGPPAPVAGVAMRKGPAVTDESAGDSAPTPDNRATTKIPRPNADDFQPDVPVDGPGPVVGAGAEAAPGDQGTMPVSTVSPPASGRPPADYGGDPTREGLPFDIPREPPIEAATSDEDVHLIPGATIGGGRYRLLVFHGGPPNLQFWQALDTALDRQVGADVRRSRCRPVRQGAAGDPGPHVAAEPDRESRRRPHPRRREHGIGRPGRGEWIRGGSLQEVAETSPSPIGGARAMQTLAAAAEQAHRAGVAMSIDHPSRVRVSIEGDVALAFPATMPDATPEDDIRGIGAALYALLVNRWPLAGVRCAQRVEPAEVDAPGEPVEPRSQSRHPVPDLGRGRALGQAAAASEAHRRC